MHLKSLRVKKSKLEVLKVLEKSLSVLKISCRRYFLFGLVVILNMLMLMVGVALLQLEVRHVRVKGEICFKVLKLMVIFCIK